MLYPLKFQPLQLERVWGGHALARFGKEISPGQFIGETWEICDRDNAQSIVANGPLTGQTLRQLVKTLGTQLLGTNSATQSSTGVSPVHVSSKNERDARAPRFPLLIKLLDARERLSLQVHPPAAIAAQLGGEPKTEMWYILDAAPDAHLIAGLRRGTTREQFERALLQSATIIHPPSSNLASSSVLDLVHRFPVAAGDSLFVPSGRIHSIDAGIVLVEVQQSSDTTFRVSDWGRVGLDGKPRELHIAQSLACINFADIEPRLVAPQIEIVGGNERARLVECEHFHVHKLTLRQPWPDHCDGSSFQIIGCIAGTVAIQPAVGPEEILRVCEFALLPAALGQYTATPQSATAAVLKAWVPKSLS